MHIIKITAERDTILSSFQLLAGAVWTCRLPCETRAAIQKNTSVWRTALALAAIQIILPPVPPYNPSLESIPVNLKKEKIAKSGAKAKMCPSQPKNGHTTDEFNAYYNFLTSTQHTEYDQDTANLVASNTWNKTVCDSKIL
ncbi:hypothetical protein P692DRAFT_20819322 [Suillus brevipes Sb2]|nr:hypothetical protein P692DRAFT_20819322 [Suillus brevipes Sb2]